MHVIYCYQAHLILIRETESRRKINKQKLFSMTAQKKAQTHTDSCHQGNRYHIFCYAFAMCNEHSFWFRWMHKWYHTFIHTSIWTKRNYCFVILVNSRFLFLAIVPLAPSWICIHFALNRIMRLMMYLVLLLFVIDALCFDFI